MATVTVDAGAGKIVWAGRALAGLVVLFLLYGAVTTVLGVPGTVEGMVGFGYSEGAVFGIGLALLVATVLYAIPRTAVFGAVLLTGYLGGATATHVRLEDGLFLSPVLFGVALWLALYAREPRLRELVPLRRGSPRGGSLRGGSL